MAADAEACEDADAAAATDVTEAAVDRDESGDCVAPCSVGDSVAVNGGVDDKFNVGDDDKFEFRDKEAFLDEEHEGDEDD